MAALRSARLEAIFGKRIADLTASDIHTLVAERVHEAFDLDFKRGSYGRSDRDKRDCAGDVAALANTAGGVIILGVEEDDQARATAAPGVEASDDEISRINKTAASGLAPIPRYDVIGLEDQPGSGRGFIVIAVPRSPAAPHGVLINDGLRYPRRNNRDIRYLSEPEIAEAYRRRFASADLQVTLASDAERDVSRRLYQADEACWLVLALAPDLLGETPIDQDAALAFRNETAGRSPDLFVREWSWAETTVGRRRHVAACRYTDTGHARRLYTELHTTGVGAFAREVASATYDGGLLLADVGIAASVISGLHFLARHARDRAAADGNALVTATLQASVPLTLGTDWGASEDAFGARQLKDFGPSAERVIPLDALATQGPALVAAAHLLATDVVQTFGCPETVKFTRDGRIRRPYWRSDYFTAVRGWAERAGVEIANEHLQQ